MLQNIKDEGKVAKLKHRTAWMRMERAKRVGQPWYGDSQAKGSGEAHDGLNGDSEAQIRPRVDRIPGYGTVGWAGRRQLRVRLKSFLLAVYPTWVAGSSHSSGVRSGGVLVGWVGGCRGRRGYTHLAATCESYGEGDEFWTSGLMPK
jgi:hypothetical protein